MRNTIWLGSFVLLFACCTSRPVHAAAAAKPEAYKPGTGESVKFWGEAMFDRVKTLGMPVCVYTFSTKGKMEEAERLEGTDFLGNADVRKSFVHFQCVKLNLNFDPKNKNQRAFVESWPKELLAQARSMKFAVFLFNSDFMPQGVFSYEGGAFPPNAKNLQTILERIAKFEAEKKARIEKQENANKPKEADVPKAITVPGLGDDDKDKKKSGKGGDTKPASSKPNIPTEE